MSTLCGMKSKHLQVALAWDQENIDTISQQMACSNLLHSGAFGVEFKMCNTFCRLFKFAQGGVGGGVLPRVAIRLAMSCVGMAPTEVHLYKY